MRFFSKFVFICNICFIVTVVMHFIELGDKVKGKTDVVAELQFVEGTMAVLGLISLLVNAIFCFFVLVSLVAKSQTKVPRWMMIFNFIALLAEIYWFIIDK